ncbi:calcitonin gene-related peptide 2-like [Artibeus jamaicensis]|uniref:calcitonin gene-related peptide 2-like n=1 Tax=Artibeus jamaicensis TaxID=9417 RepID=UPI00187BDEAB|nr:calcitonin gene-related peptide 2-like [Artibeus jamaicensis]
MGFGKSSPFLAFSILVLCQAGGLQAAPLRSALESLPDLDPAALSEKEGRLLLAALLKAYVERKTNELEQEEQETEDSSVTAQKRACNTSTCVTHRLADLLSRSGGVVKSDFVPTNVGSDAYGRRRRRRDLQA